jgi:hypothetical protein
LHAAISPDEGRTWDGFREVLRDRRRLEPALPIRGDYGTGYPVGAATRDKTLVFAAGQGATNGVFLLDPDWLTATQEQEHFEHGLETWSLYGTKGVGLVAHPQRKAARVLKLERTDVELPAAAVWNFPNGRAGHVGIRFRLLPGSAETAITLTDHFSSPFDREAELNSLYTLTLGPASLRGAEPLAANAWHELTLSWDFRSKTCRCQIDGRAGRSIPQLRALSEGANYLRFHVLRDGPSRGGLLVESVTVQVDLSVPAEPGAPR